jgi:DMSO/TMAO reductase YedYZ molybdopterin-dependent catalytic subunit
MGLAGFLLTGTIGGAVLFYVLQRVKEYKPSYTPGLILGAVVGIPMMLVSSSINFTATADPIIGAIWTLIVMVGWGAAHSWIYNDLLKLPVDSPASASVTAIDRRQFIIRIGGATATLTVIGAGLGALLGQRNQVSTVSIAAADPEATPAVEATEAPETPNVDASLEPAPGTRPEITPLEDHYRIDISSRPPTIDGATWVLPITGLVENPVELSLADLRNNYDALDQFVTISCISNQVGGDLIGTTRWTGVSLQTIMDEVKPQGSHLKITGADGFDEVLDLSLAKLDDRVMLAYDWDGQPLTEGHGFPLRVFIPDHYGMKQPKWINGMEVIDGWQEGYWVRRGWSETALVNATSVIDTVAVDSAIEDGDNLLIPIGGIAYAGDRGISKVEIKVDDGDWVEAQLRESVSELTWVIWRYDWPFEEGSHNFQVRCVEGNGTQQVESSRGVRPDGATGIDSVTQALELPEEEQA